MVSVLPPALPARHAIALGGLVLDLAAPALLMAPVSGGARGVPGSHYELEQYSGRTRVVLVSYYERTRVVLGSCRGRARVALGLLSAADGTGESQSACQEFASRIHRYSMGGWVEWI